MDSNATLFDVEPKELAPSAAIEELFGEEDPSLLSRAMREIPERIGTELSATRRLAWTADDVVVGAAKWPVKALGSSLPQLARPGRLSLTRISRPQLPALPSLPGYLPSPTHHPPRTIFNRHVRNPQKNLSVVSLPLREVREVRAATRATVNDVLLALVTGSLPRYLAGRGELLEQPLRTTCPVNVRTGSESDGPGNHITTMWVELAVHLADPAERLAYIHASTTAAKNAVSVPDSAHGSHLPPVAVVVGRADCGERVRRTTSIAPARAPGGGIFCSSTVRICLRWCGRRTRRWPRTSITTSGMTMCSTWTPSTTGYRHLRRR